MGVRLKVQGMDGEAKKVNYQHQIKDYGVGVTANLFRVVIGDLYNKIKQLFLKKQKSPTCE
jgi:hypothetical protein